MNVIKKIYICMKFSNVMSLDNEWELCAYFVSTKTKRHSII